MGSDALGNLIWQKKYGSPKFQYLDNILAPRGAIYKDANAFYHALTVRDSNNYQIGVLIKFNFNGDTLWQKVYREISPKDVILQGLTKSIDNGFLLTGASQELGGQVCLLIKTDINGNELWRKRINKITPNVQDGHAIVQDTASKKIIIAGYQYIGNSSSWDTYSNILIIDSLGTKTVQTTFNNSGGGGFDEVIQLRDKNFLACGSWYASSDPKYYGFIVKFGITGNLIWSKKLNVASTYNLTYFLYELKNGDIMALGRLDTMANHFQSAIIKLQLLKLDKNGNIKFKKYIGSSYDDVNSETPGSMNPTQDGGFIIASRFPFTNSPAPYSIIKIDSTGCDTTEQWCQSVALGISNFNALSGYNFEIYPNPANDILHLKIETPIEKSLALKIIDISGREIETLSIEPNNNVQLNTADYKTEVYFVSLIYEGKTVDVRKLLIVR